MPIERDRTRRDIYRLKTKRVKAGGQCKELFAGSVPAQAALREDK